MNAFASLAKSLLSFADSAVCSDASSRRLFTWWVQLPKERDAPKTVIAAAVNGPLRESAQAAHGFVERVIGREVFNVFCQPVNGRPYLPENRKPERGHTFQSAMCLVGSNGMPVNDAGEVMTVAPIDAAKFRVVSCERHPQVSSHWHVEADPA